MIKLLGEMHRMNTKKLWIALSLFVITAFSQTSFAQGLNWDGQTGALLTPFAYTAAAPASKFGKPEVSFHYLNSGNVIGNDYQLSITEGFGKHFEFGYTQAFSSSGNVSTFPLSASADSSYPVLGKIEPSSSLFSNGFSELHGKLTVINENAGKNKWVPAIAVGAIGRFGGQRLSYFITPAYNTPGATETNGDFYVVATKTVTQVKGLPFVLSIGDKVTDASVLGVAGNAGNANGTGQRWQGRAFGAAAFVVKGPAKSALIFGAEVLQQPHYIQGLNDFVNGAASGLLGVPVTGLRANIPTSESYFVRIVPHVEGSPLQIDLGVAHVGGDICKVPGVAALDINANARVGMGVSYHF
jgi:hypothetical protein